MDSPITIKILANAIQTDPQSWRSMGLLYGNIEAPESSNETCFIAGDDGRSALVGKISTPELRPDIEALFYIRDIAQQAELAAKWLGSTYFRESSSEVCHAKLPQAVTFLVVEDDPMSSKLVTQHLQKYGRVITTKNAREATANHTVNNPDIIFLDIHYHDDIHDGFDVLANILSVNPKAFVVMFSGDKNPTTIVRALSLGAKGFIAKPFNAEIFSFYLDKYNSHLKNS